MNTTAAAAAAAAGCRPPFTASQWQELEHQALIFKYLMAGIPVPPDLLLPIRKSLESMAARFYHHPTMGYCSFYGKKMDPEPGRCRRTDGKKWRCSKEAHPDSKYCERHMHRGRNRSRKPVETQNISQPQSSSSSPSSTVTSLAPSGSGASGGSCSGGAGSLPSGIPLQSLGGGSGSGSSSSSRANQVSLAGTSLNQLHMDPGPFGMGSSRDYGYLRGVKPEVDAHSFFGEASGSARGIGNDFSLDSTWRLMPSQASYTLPKPGNSSLLQGNYHQLQPVLDFSHETMSSLSKQQQQQQQQQHCFFGSDFDSSGPVKHESQPLRPFFDEWPKTRDSWSELEDDRSNRTSFSTTQLSISIPMASSDFSTTSSRSPNADD